MLGSLLGELTTAYHGVHQRITWRSAFVYGSILLASYLLYILIIQPLTSPLRKIPGMQFIPLRGNMGSLMKGEAMEASIKMMIDYGTVMRYYFMFGSERLMITDPDVMKYVLITNSKNYIKPPGRFKMLKVVLGEGLVMSEGNKHAVHKRLMSPSFNRASIKSMLPIFNQVGQNLSDLWKQQIGHTSSSEIPVHADLGKTTIDIVGKAAFGYEFNALKDGNTPVVAAFQRILSGSGLSWRMFIPMYFMLPFPENNRLWNDLTTMRNTVDSIIAKKRQEIDKHDKTLESVAGDVLGMMMLARDEATGVGMTDLELRDEVMTLMLAGHETTAVAMAWSLLQLAQRQDLQDLMRQEILSVCPDPSKPVTWDELEQLEFCGRFIKEILRMYPPVPLTLRQAVGPDVLQGQYPIPKDTIMMMAIGPMMRNPELFPDPDTFNPDRYLDQDANKLLYSLIPFLIGPRMCIGNKFAQQELRSLLVILLRQFRFETIPGQTYKRQIRTTMRPDPPLHLKVSAYCK